MDDNKSTTSTELLEKLKDMFDSLMTSAPLPDYPKEAVPLGTIVRCIKHDRLGFVTDAFYGDVDKVGTKIIVYTVFLLPQANKLTPSRLKAEQMYITNEYEYDVIAYLMIPAVDIEKVLRQTGGNYLL